MVGRVWLSFVKDFPESPEAKEGRKDMAITELQCCYKERTQRGSMYLTEERLYFHSNMLGKVKEVVEELAGLKAEADASDRINKGIFVHVDRQSGESVTHKFLSFRKDVQSVIADIHAARDAKDSKAKDESKEEKEKGEESGLASDNLASKEAEERAERERKEKEANEREAKEEEEKREAQQKQEEERRLNEKERMKQLEKEREAGSVHSRARPPTLSQAHSQSSATEVTSQADSVRESIRKRQLAAQKAKQSYAEKLKQKAESQAAGSTRTVESLKRDSSTSSSGTSSPGDDLGHLFPFAKRFVALFALLFVSSVVIMPSAVVTETWGSLFAAAIVMSALDVALKPKRLASSLAEVLRPMLLKDASEQSFGLTLHQSGSATAALHDSLHIVLTPAVHFLELWLAECLLPGFHTSLFAAVVGVISVSIPSFVSLANK